MAPLKQWHWRSLALEGRSGSSIFNTLFRHQKIATLLESPNPSSNERPHPLPHPLSQSRYSICAGSPRIIDGRLQLWTPPIGQILNCLDQLLKRPTQPLNHDAMTAGLPFVGGWLGWLGYDLAWEIERLPWLRPDSLPFPTAYWYEPDSFAVLDHGQQQLWLAASQPPELDVLEQTLSSPPSPRDQPIPRIIGDPQITYLTSQADYEALASQAKRHIQAGDIFQANLSLRFAAQSHIDPWTLYQNLQHINPSPFASYWQTPWGAVVSCSPERLVQLQGRQAQTRPIAGTRSRGTTPEQDQQQAQDLRVNAKEQAEHTMLVDLERNDLGRVCCWGSVRVNELLALEFYSHVVHLVSNVIGTLHPSKNPVDLIRAMFPGGTITGCPKVRCMEIIEQLEPLRRSLFYGSCGYLDYRGHLDLNILIRTLLVTSNPNLLNCQSASDPISPPNVVWGQVGAGIVADSRPDQEWHESLQKAQAQLVALKRVAP